MIGLVISPKPAAPEPALQPRRIIVPVSVETIIHSKYLSQQHKEEVVLPALALQLAQAILDSGLLTIAESGLISQKGIGEDDKLYPGYRKIEMSVTLINPLSTLHNADV